MTSSRRIGPSSEQPLIALAEVWSRRELLYFLAWRDVRIRYSQTLLGVMWAVLQPLIMMAIFTVIFGRIAPLRPGQGSYALFVLAALVPWQLFAGSVSNASDSVISNAHMVTKIYFPRILLPMASVAAALADFVIALVLLVVVMALSGMLPSHTIIAVPAYIALTIVTASGVGIWLAALTAEYRDFRFITRFLLQVWFFATPIVYDAATLPAWGRALAAFNPMTFVVEGFRWALLGSPAPSTATVAGGTLVSLFLLLSGVAWFQRIDDRIADVV